jgi:hypothetical protein
VALGSVASLLPALWSKGSVVSVAYSRNNASPLLPFTIFFLQAAKLASEFAVITLLLRCSVLVIFGRCLHCLLVVLAQLSFNLQHELFLVKHFLQDQIITQGKEKQNKMNFA